MPVLRSVTEYRVSGRRRRIRLYEAWRNMIGRTHGGKSRRRGLWRGLCVGFKDWPEFRAWALTHGYSKKCNSLDRKNTGKGYFPDNLRWVTVADNTANRWL